MALIRKVRGHEPVIGENTFLAETAVILGDVTIGRDCSIWYNAVLRGDVNRIVIGDRTNIQDGVVLHTIYDKAKHPSQTIIGNDVSVGHNAIIHGAVIGDNCLTGMGATLLDNARIPSGCIIAANALVLSNAQLEPNSVYAGVPAKKVKEVTAEQREEIIRRTARDYMLYASWYGEPEEGPGSVRHGRTRPETAFAGPSRSGSSPEETRAAVGGGYDRPKRNPVIFS